MITLNTNRAEAMGFKMIEDDSFLLINSLTKTGRYIFDKFSATMDDETNIKDVSPGLRHKMRKEAGVTDTTVWRALKELKEKNILIEIEKGEYMLNPEIVSRCERKKKLPELIRAYKNKFNHNKYLKDLKRV